ncbi:TfoX/Sxy family protein [Glaciibacter superstes]|uniref:TfoX/Sxy family protein n=1 Tax=Glaciibacter superstes TaxID=501023 RepID=UPI0003B66256|nr:TfoX/Sxy family protein [Glaciibacter superstes]
MTTAQNALIERLRDLVTDEPIMREVSMFGGRSFMVNEKMILSALKDGGLLVRVAADQHEELVSHHGAVQAEMGAGREMGPGWIEVAAESISDDENLAFWFEVAMEYNRAVTGGSR